MAFFSKHKAVVVILIAAVFLRLIVVVTYWDHEPYSDANAYYHGAISIVSGEGYRNPENVITAYFPVGYPLALAALFSIVGVSVKAALLFNVLLSTILLISIYFITRYWFEDTIAVAALALMAFFPPQIFYTGFVLTEVFATTCLMTAMALFLYGRTGFSAGILFGLAILTRPPFAAIAGVFFLWQMIKEKKLYPIALSVLICILLGWMIRNQLVMGTFSLSTNTGPNLLIGNSPTAGGYYQRIEGYAGNEVQRNQAMLKDALEYIKGNFAYVVVLWPFKLFYLFMPDQSLIPPFYDQLPPLLYTINTIYHIGLLAICAAMLVFHLRKIVSRQLLPAFLIAAGSIMSIIFFGAPRFSFPIMPFISMYVAQMLVLLKDQLSRRRSDEAIKIA